MSAGLQRERTQSLPASTAPQTSDHERREQDDFAEFHGNLLQCIQHVLVSNFLRHNRLGRELDLTIRIVDRHDSRCLHQPSPYVMQTMKHDLKEPCPAVRTHLETMK